MKILKEINGSRIRLECIGKLDAMSAPGFREAVSEIDFSQTEDAALDFENVPYVSSAGLRELLILKKKLRPGVPLRIENASQEVVEIFQTTGFSDYLVIERAEAAAELTGMSFGDFLAYKAETVGDKEILSFAGKTYTWKEADAVSSVIAEELYRLGVRKGAHVALCGANSANWVFTFYAIQKLGAIALLLNPQLTEAELVKYASIGDVGFFCLGETPALSDASARQRVTEAAGAAKLLNVGKDIDFSQRAQPLIDRYAAAVRADDPCVMVFTSGSTGRPKGVMLSAYNILSAACANAESLELTSADRACLILPMFHIFGLVAGLFANAAADARMYIPEDVRIDAVVRTVSENRCTVLHAVPTQFLAFLKSRNFDPEKLGTLRSTILSGAPAPEAQLRQLCGLFPHNHFAVSYGMSEMAPISITDYGDTFAHISRTVGRPVKNIQVRIYDNEAQKECAAGQVGEIQVQGYNLMACYYKEDLEKQAIHADGWMRTGDLGAFDTDGYLRFVGRLKELIIRGGENVVPNEIVAALCEEDCVSDARVYGVPDDFYGERVAAAITLSNPEEYSRSRLFKSLASKLAPYKLPDWFLVYDSFPLLPNGKVDGVTLKADVIEKCTAKRKAQP